MASEHGVTRRRRQERHGAAMTAHVVPLPTDGVNGQMEHNRQEVNNAQRQRTSVNIVHCRQGWLLAGPKPSITDRTLLAESNKARLYHRSWRL